MSEYPTKSQSAPLGYRKPICCVPERYLIMCLTAMRCNSFGDAWKQAHTHTLNIISGCDVVRKRRDPIIPRYLLYSTGFLSSLSRLHEFNISIVITLDFSVPNLFIISLQHLDWFMNVPLLVWWIWSPRKYFSSPIIDISNSLCITSKNSLHKDSLLAPKIILLT